MKIVLSVKIRTLDRLRIARSGFTGNWSKREQVSFCMYVMVDVCARVVRAYVLINNFTTFPTNHIHTTHVCPGDSE